MTGGGKGGPSWRNPMTCSPTPSPLFSFLLQKEKREVRGEELREREGPTSVADLVGVGRRTGRSHREHLQSQGFPEVPIIPHSSQGPHCGQRAQGSTAAPTYLSPPTQPQVECRGSSKARLKSRNCGSRGQDTPRHPLPCTAPTEAHCEGAGKISKVRVRGLCFRGRTSF